jgi:hypothetical protein
MKQIDKDREELQRLVEAYGKEDVTNFVKSQITSQIAKARPVSPIKQEAIDNIMVSLEGLDLEPYQLQNIKSALNEAYDSGYDEAEKKCKKKIKALEKRVSDAGWQYEYDHRDDWRKPSEMGQW